MKYIFNNRASSTSQIPLLRVDKEDGIDPDCTQHLLCNTQGETTENAIVPISTTLANRNATLTNRNATFANKNRTVSLNASDYNDLSFWYIALALLMNVISIVGDTLIGGRYIDNTMTIKDLTEDGSFDGDFDAIGPYDGVITKPFHEAVICRSDFSFICSGASTLLVFCALITLGYSFCGARHGR